MIKNSITSINHPEYLEHLTEWDKFRAIFEGGDDFISEYLEKFSKRETSTDYATRLALTYNPAHSSAALQEIQNAIYQRMCDIERIGGSDTYINAVAGLGRGVDRRNSSMNTFMGCNILPELLFMGKVGIFVDRPVINKPNPSIADMVGKNPYVYFYAAESIKSWNYDEEDRLVSLLLIDYDYTHDPDSNLINGTAMNYRKIDLVDGHVEVRKYNSQGKEDTEVTIINLPEIPFVIIELPIPLLRNVANHQIALLNIASSDVMYAIKSNTPLYTEQFNPQTDNIGTRPVSREETLKDTDGTVITAGTAGASTTAQVAKNKEIIVGITKGRRYPKGLERPGFINPSPDPLRVSMEKENQIKEEIRQLIHLNITSLAPQRASAESKAYGDRGLEDGLAYIGFALQKAENEIARFWALYEKSEQAQVIYPNEYSLKTTQERIDEATKLFDIIPKTPSIEAQRALMKRAMYITISSYVKSEKMQEIFKQINEATVMDIDPDHLYKDIETNLASNATVSQLRGYAKGESEKAAIDHADRLARIAIAQSDAAKDSDPSLRKAEKQESQNADKDASGKRRVRGEGQ